jgi:hypothetical protein
MEFLSVSMYMVHMSGFTGSRSARKVICTIKHFNETKDKVFNVVMTDLRHFIVFSTFESTVNDT